MDSLLNDSPPIVRRMAYMITKQPASGCFHEEAAGTATSDVHVIDLQSAEGLNNNTEDDEDISGNLFMPAVYLSMTPDSNRGSSYDSDEIMHRNLTLILNSRQKVNWFLESQGIAGQLKVISTNGPVSDYDLSPSQQLLVERKSLPAAFDQLWKAVVSKTGNSPISYARVNKANVVTIIVPTRSKRAPLFQEDLKNNKATIVPDPREQIIIPGGRESNEKSRTHRKFIERLENQLSMYLQKTCNQQKTIIALPIAATSTYDVVGVHLNEAQCEGKKNQTHWILTTKR